MTLTLRRTRAVDPERDAELPHTIDVEALHALLHQRGQADLAAALLLRLTPEGARDLAALLTWFRRRHSTPGPFRSYRRLLDAAGARHVDLAVAFLRGAGSAGCRVYPNPNDEGTVDHTAQPQRLYALPLTAGEGDGRDVAGAPGTGNDEGERPRGIMPPWLPAPHGSSWDR